MTFLYLTGTALTVTRHPWNTWEFARDVAFNLLGYSLLLHGWRAMWVSRRPVVLTRSALDLALLLSLIALVTLTTALAVLRANTPMHVFAVLGMGLVALEIRDWRRGELSRAVLQRRHGVHRT